ncbi:hypothetical protein AVEN_153709-1 [Araneus ventricosus]|uniref:Uncharacterized protein n=1 Tax=Araneus ventricosus TaxID=182803 RepID=A0A4Y2NG09_ARAVE|nr:hypothetical protein AVEN_153709-1 [Araneus ventricosus]
MSRGIVLYASVLCSCFYDPNMDKERMRIFESNSVTTLLTFVKTALVLSDETWFERGRTLLEDDERSFEEIQSGFQKVLDALQKASFQDTFQKWQERCIAV